MAMTPFQGPLVAFGVTQTSTAVPTSQVTDYNDQRAPSLFDLGIGISDPRVPYSYDPGGAVTEQNYGFWRAVGSVDFAPTAVSSNLLAISSNTQPTAGSAITLISSKTGVTSTTIVAPETGKTSGTLLCLDSTAVAVGFGQSGTIAMWNPAAGAGRCIVISPSSNLDAGTFSIAGRDIYGFKVTETIAAGSTTLTSQKAYKYISSITASTTITSTGVGVGTTDIYGFPFLVSEAGPANLTLAVSTGAGGGKILASVSPTSGTVVFGSTVATQTSTTPDVRGTWASSVASGSSAFFQITVTPSLAAVSGITNTSVSTLFGGTQYSSV